MVITLSEEVLDIETIRKYAKSREKVLTNFLKTIKGVLRAKDIVVVDDEVLPLAVISDRPNGSLRLVEDAYHLLKETKSESNKLKISFFNDEYIVVYMVLYKEDYFTLVFNAKSLPAAIEERLTVIGEILKRILTVSVLSLQSIDELIQVVLEG
jgi:hypothetical protein